MLETNTNSSEIRKYIHNYENIYRQITDNSNRMRFVKLSSTITYKLSFSTDIRIYQPHTKRDVSVIAFGWLTVWQNEPKILKKIHEL